MVRPLPEPSEFFTAEQANEMLPLVRRIATDWVRLHELVERQRLQGEGLQGLKQRVDVAVYSEEVAEIEQSLRNDEAKLDRCRRELKSLGVTLHPDAVGFVDFPAQRDGREIRFCWQLGEPSVQYWHEIGAGIEKRKRLIAEPSV